MKIIAIQNYYDKELKKQIYTGDSYEVSKERAEVIVNANYAKYGGEEDAGKKEAKRHSKRTARKTG